MWRKLQHWEFPTHNAKSDPSTLWVCCNVNKIRSRCTPTSPTQKLIDFICILGKFPCSSPWFRRKALILAKLLQLLANFSLVSNFWHAKQTYLGIIFERLRVFLGHSCSFLVIQCLYFFHFSPYILTIFDTRFDTNPESPFE